MKNRSRLSRQRGYALITVLMMIGAMALLTASMLRYSASERRLNERNRLLLRARNMSENISVYAAEQLTTKLYRLRSTTPMAFMSGSNEIDLPPDSVLTTQYTSPSGMEVRAGLTSTSGLVYIDPLNAANAGNTNAGLQVITSQVPIIAKATATHPAVGTITAYCQHDLEVAMIPLFQFAIFYNMDLEFGPGADMTIAGPVHTNGSLIARGQTGFANTVAFLDRVTATGGFYANTGHKGSTYMDNGAVDAGPGGTGPLTFRHATSGTATNIYNSADSRWRDHKFSASPGSATETATTQTQFRTFATSSYAGNLRTSVHGVTSLVLPAVSDYNEANDPSTAEDDRNNGRQIIEPPSTADTAGLKETKISRRAGLYIVVNPDDETRNGKMPDGSPVAMRARSYRAWLNHVTSSGTHTVYEVVLPGQPSYGPLNAYVNNLPNAYRADTSVRHNQVLRIPQGGGVDRGGTGYDVGTAAPTMASFDDAWFYDLRRATNNTGAIQNRATAAYAPRPIAKIDFDLTRFKMAVERTLLSSTSSTIYFPAKPYDAATWGDFIFNPSANRDAYGLGIDADHDGAFDDFTSETPIQVIDKSVAGAYTPDQLVIRAWEQTGNGSISAHAGRFVIADTTDNGATWTDRLASTGDESSRIYAPNAAITHVRVRLYHGGAAPAANRLFDEEIIPIVTAGTATVVAALSSDYHTAATSNGSGNPANWAVGDATTEMRVYVGGADDSENWTFSVGATTGGLGGAFGTGIYANRFTCSAITSNTGSITLSATKGATTVSRVFTVTKQSSTANNTPANRTIWLTMNTRLDADPFRIYFAPGSPDTDPNYTSIRDNPASFAVAAASLVNTSAGSETPWFDGITVYIHSVDAEVRAQTAGTPQRIDSAVRLWHGRGPLISLTSSMDSTYAGRTGMAFATNDAVYVIGHYNTNGAVNATSTDNTNPGGYSARYPDASSEMLTSVMGDAITIVSQPVFENPSGTIYRQSSGWSDSLSAHRRDDGSTFAWSSSWATSNPSASNRQEGIDLSFVPAAMPSMGNTNPGASGAARTAKFTPSTTEISACFLIGIVPTNHNPNGITGVDSPPTTLSNGQTSGGVHNYPRLLEAWGGTVPLYIRGSMVAMFESRVAMEPWSIRVYTGAIRNWGLHQSLRNANHDLPLEPMVLNARRARYKEITAAQYAAQKAVIEALPH